MFGISGYRPCFFKTKEEFLRHRAALLRDMVGRPLAKVVCAWDDGAGEWFGDMPVLLYVGGDCFAVQNVELSCLALDKNVLGGTEPISWYGATGYRWREYACGEIKGSIVLDALPLTDTMYFSVRSGGGKAAEHYDPPLAETVLSGLRLIFEKGRLDIVNGLDENKIVLSPVENG